MHPNQDVHPLNMLSVRCSWSIRCTWQCHFIRCTDSPPTKPRIHYEFGILTLFGVGLAEEEGLLSVIPCGGVSIKTQVRFAHFFVGTHSSRSSRAWRSSGYQQKTPAKPGPVFCLQRRREFEPLEIPLYSNFFGLFQGKCTEYPPSKCDSTNLVGIPNLHNLSEGFKVMD